MENKPKLSEIRKEYSSQPLIEDDIVKDPIKLFKNWFNQVLKGNIPEPNAMSLSTVDSSNKPSTRVVLLKGIEKQSFVFYTNYNSRKGKEININPNVCLNFFWLELAKQVRIEGVAEKISKKESDEYFHSRPFGSKIGALVSKQSQIINGRKELDKKFEALSKQFEKKEDQIEKPEHWGGYAVKPNKIEFWQGRENRLHDRILYTKEESSSWSISRLSP